MRFSGPKMVFYHPVIAFSHLAETKRQKRKLKKQRKKGVRICWTKNYSN